MGSPERVLATFNEYVKKYSRLPTEFDPDYMELLRMSKYRVLDVPDFSPGSCANCGSAKNDGRKYVDFGLQIDWYGTVFLCGACLHDVADTMGLFDEVNEKLNTLEENDQRFLELKEQGEILHEAVVDSFREFEKYYDSLHSYGVDSHINNTPSVEPDSSAPEPGINPPKLRAVKSTPSSGRSNVRSLTELLGNPDLP